MIINERFNKWLTAPLPTWTTRRHRALAKFDLGVSGADLRVRAAQASHPTVRTPNGVNGFRTMLIVRPIAALVGFVAAATQGWWLVALPLAGVVYGSALTCVHHLIHSSLGLAPRWRHFWIRWIGLMVVESGHALQVTHLAHHRTGRDVPDPEGYIEYATWKEMPVAALKFRYRLMFAGYKMAPLARRRRIAVEIIGHAVLHFASLALLPITPLPWVYLTLIHVASFAFAILAGKGPQTNYGRELATPNVRVHTTLGKVVFFSHDQHLEHHAAPKVPLPHLRRLSNEMDTAFAQLDVLDVRMPL